ncbi:MAG: pyruvate, phosphate dikinase, partial [Alphaproteobacteria bacterium]|nr:pyruvate, phosphate dikinase [Alphaproteobacteria bacterium]
MGKWVYAFGGEHSEGSAEMRELLGGKGANLAEMASIGLPVPPGFTITTEVCTHYFENVERYPDDLEAAVAAGVAHIEQAVGAAFGDRSNPLLVSVRSGARVSMPGMMDTVLNLGLNDESVEGLAAASGDARFAYDSYRRFIQMYSDVVLGVDHAEFEDLLEAHKDAKGVYLDTDLDANNLKRLVDEYKDLVQSALGAPFPQDPKDQLWGAVSAVFGSWQTPRAVTYRRLHDIPEEWGTAVNIQAMVFGNMGDDCATGVAFTRDPSTGENAFYGEYLVNAQGEDVVAGIRTPQQLTTAGKEAQGSRLPAMEETMPGVFQQLVDIRKILEKHYRDMQDIEFTVQKDKLYMLQTRSGKRTTGAAIRIAVEMEKEGLIEKAEAVCRVEPAALDQLLHPRLDPDAARDVIAKGLPASPGAASGQLYFSADEAEAAAAQGAKVILVRVETSPEDIHGMHAAQGILTARGGMTSHAAVVARGMGRPCVVGAGELVIDYAGKTMSAGDVTIAAGETITIDGAMGQIIRGEVATIQPEMSGDFATLMSWADNVRTLGVHANADTPEDARTAREFGAEGIGLCRTEHMFFETERIVAMREMILSEDEAGRRAALAKLLPMQRDDFAELFRVMKGLPVTIRLLDPPLNEFLPTGDAEMADVAASAGIELERVKARVAQLHEMNPMLGHRGCRLAISYPEVCEMQARAMFEAALIAAADTGEAVKLEVMVPLIATKAELDLLKGVIDRVACEVEAEKGPKPEYITGTMIELPRAALRAGEIAETAEFFSFGTNDLTQTVYGLSRDDAASFIPTYERAGILPNDPFASIDVGGVGELVSLAVERGRKTRDALKLGICGEHGGDPASVAFCHQVGLNYVSCSPFRVPIARLA